MNNTEIYAQTAAKLGIEPGKVSKAVRHHFKQVEAEMKDPTVSGSLIGKLGGFNLNQKRIRHYLLKQLIPNLRENRDSVKIKRRFKKYWKMRNIQAKWKSGWVEHRRSQNKSTKI